MKARLSTVLTVVIVALASATATDDFRPSHKFKSIGPVLQRLNAFRREIRNTDSEEREASKDINWEGGFPILHPNSGFDPNPIDDSSETFGPIYDANTTTPQSTSTEKTTSSHVSVEDSTTASHTSTEKTTPSHVSVEDTTTTSHTSTEKTTPSHVSVEDITTTSHTSTEKTTPSHVSVEDITTTPHTSTEKTTLLHTSTTETSYDETTTSRKSTTTTTAHTTEADVQPPPPAEDTMVEVDEYDGEDSDDENENEDEEKDDDEDENEDEDDENEDSEDSDHEDDDHEDDEKEDDDEDTHDSSEEDSDESSEENFYTSDNVSEEEEVRVPLNSNDRGINSKKTLSPEKKKTSNFICLYPGRFRDPFDCRKYYVCREVINPKVKVIPYLYRCPDNTWFSNYFKKCVRFKPGICRDASA